VCDIAAAARHKSTRARNRPLTSPCSNRCRSPHESEEAMSNSFDRHAAALFAALVLAACDVDTMPQSTGSTAAQSESAAAAASAEAEDEKETSHGKKAE
jgi:hypothetical protein